MSTAAVVPLRRVRVVVRGLAITAIAAPPLVFFGILFSHLTGLPVRDDYDAILAFANGLVTTPNKLWYSLACQFNEYKLVFLHFVTWTQLALMGRLDFRVLSVVGDLFVLPIGWLLWKMFLPETELQKRLVLFVPVSMLWFQLEYVGTLNFSMSALQYMPALLFAMSCIYLLSEHKGILGALACFVLAVASSGNGLFLIPVGFLMLLRARRYRHLVVWIVTSALVTWLYFYQYDFSASARPNIGNQGVQFGWDVVGFLLSFVGGILSIPTIYYFAGYALLICPLLGTAMCVLLFYAYRKGYFARNPAAGYCALFLLITAAAVSAMRAGFGAPQGLASRYGMNSALLLIFVWFAVADSIKDRRWNESRRWLICSVFSLAIAVVMDVYGYMYLVRRNADIRRDMVSYQQTGATPMSPRPNQPASFAARQQRAPRVLETSVKLGLYKPTNF